MVTRLVKSKLYEAIGPLSSSLFLLNDGEIAAYDNLLEGILNFNMDIRFEADNEIEPFHILRLLLLDYVELEEIVNQSRTTCDHSVKGGKVIYTYHMKYKVKNENEAVLILNDVKRKAKKILSNIGVNKTLTNDEAIEAIYKYLTSTFHYSDKKIKNEYPEYCYSLECLNKREAVCSGISKVFQLLIRMSERNISSCIVAQGKCTKRDGISDGTHAWNIVLYKGHNLHFDATWDLEKEISRWSYFALDDVRVRTNEHVWNKKYYYTY